MKVVGRRYASVPDLVRDSGDADFADAFDKHLSDRRLINGLTVLRCVRGLSQAQLAEKMGCGQPKVSKLESSVDADINFGDFVDYALALGRTVRIALTPGRANGADHLRFHAACLEHELHRLERIAGADKSIGDGIEAFAIETMRGMMAMIVDAIEKLPHRVEEAASPVSVEVEGERGERLSLDAPRRVRKGPRKALPSS